MRNWILAGMIVLSMLMSVSFASEGQKENSTAVLAPASNNIALAVEVTDEAVLRGTRGGDGMEYDCNTKLNDAYAFYCQLPDCTGCVGVLYERWCCGYTGYSSDWCENIEMESVAYWYCKMDYSENPPECRADEEAGVQILMCYACN